jgi:hypothetical protein
MSLPITLTQSLANDSGAQLEKPMSPTCMTSRVLSALWSPTPVWQLLYSCQAANITNAARVALGSPPAYRVRPTWYMPAQHSNSASAAVVVFIYRSEASTGFLLCGCAATIKSSFVGLALAPGIGNLKFGILGLWLPGIWYSILHAC